jgi:hypothetical protein
LIHSLIFNNFRFEAAHKLPITMKPATVVLATAALVSATPKGAVAPRAVAGTSVAAISIPPECAICDVVGIACIAACLAGGPIDPLCDLCAGVTLDKCLDVSDSLS